MQQTEEKLRDGKDADIGLGMKFTAFLGANLIRSLGHTWRIDFLNEDPSDGIRDAYPAVIYAFWHGRLLPLSFTHRKRSVHVLASYHKDGELMGRTIAHLGFGHVRGSSSVGGARAILELSRKINERYDLGITVDGPRGPRYEVKPGVVEVAKLAGAPIIPITASSSSHWTFSSWDRFELPKPFTRVFVMHGEPLHISTNAGKEELEERRKRLEMILKKITEEADDRARSRH